MIYTNKILFFEFESILEDKSGVPPFVVYNDNIQNINYYKSKILNTKLSHLDKIYLKLDCWQGDNYILRDYHRWELGQPRAYHIVCSPNFKTILEKQKLPPHRFYPAEIDVLGETHNYFVLHFIQDYLQDIDYNKSQFYRAEVLETEPILQKYAIGKIKSYKQYNKVNKNLVDNMEWIYPNNIVFKTPIYYDIWGLQGQIIISQKAKEIFEKENITGIETKELSKTEYSYLNIVMPSFEGVNS